ncbi:DUF3263 domain-containing protein [Micromonospora thermarum]|uniref:DUF3263 domain-containing protein n=1 Tax=Micromonospora thermarum TaxID=2720024 RepID=A0ABX0Z5Y7_9ACTN|nr:DUF3263 domain-containing protein [Micromonospora thermarum]NJP31551.1 DUF3263 domain-containing protein [Micromonospora thermarum]
MPPDAAPTAAEPSGDGRTGGRPTGDTRTRAAVPPPRPAPDVEAVPPDAEAVPPDDDGAGDMVPATGTADGLTERERGILDFEQQWWRHAGAKEQAIRDRFGLSATRYYQLLNALLDNPAALAAEPVLVGRLRRLRSSRARNRRR